MNKIVEEAMTNMIRRIEILESKITNFKNNVNREKTTNKNINPNLASDAQINYLRSLGGEIPEGMSKQEAAKEIDNALLNQKIKKKVVEPKEVDTDDAGLDGEDLM